ncbi:MAG: hypothetical protein HQK76_03925 [Desulfobacterales bacterium]|nr:hypothetical protein [Desulfobacterales bacterium]
MHVDLTEKVMESKLYVDTSPSDAQVRILNISERFYQGIVLSPGSYQIEASKDGYTTKKDWYELKSGEEKKPYKSPFKKAGLF